MNIDEDVESGSFLDDSIVRGGKTIFLLFPSQRQSPTAEGLLVFYEGAWFKLIFSKIKILKT